MILLPLIVVGRLGTSLGHWTSWLMKPRVTVEPMLAVCYPTLERWRRMGTGVAQGDEKTVEREDKQQR